jgi:hypothetical protein
MSCQPLHFYDQYLCEGVDILLTCGQHSVKGQFHDMYPEIMA